MQSKTISIVIPAFNESATLKPIIADIKETIESAQTVIVDDGSIDTSDDLNLSPKGKVLKHPYNMGNGAAIKSGIREAKGDVLVFMDADGQHKVSDILHLLKYMDTYDMVVGKRTNSQHASFARYLMNRAYNKLASYVTGFPVEDLTSGFRAVRGELAREILTLLPNGYSWPTTMTIVLLRSGFSLKYVPINAQDRKHGDSGINPVRDGIRFFMIIFKICTLFSPLRIFLPVSAGMFFLGLINYGYTYLNSGRFTNMSALMFTASVVIFMMGLISEQISQIGFFRGKVNFSDNQDRDFAVEDDTDSANRIE